MPVIIFLCQILYTFVFICRFTDVILEADGQQYPAHKAVLCSRQGFRSVRLQKNTQKDVLHFQEHAKH